MSVCLGGEHSRFLQQRHTIMKKLCTLRTCPECIERFSAVNFCSGVLCVIRVPKKRSLNEAVGSYAGAKFS